MNNDISNVSSRVSIIEDAVGDLHNYDDSSLISRISTLEVNFNTALDQLYQACVDKDSEPTSRTIVTAVQNIEENPLSMYGITVDELLKTHIDSYVQYTEYEDRVVVTGTKSISYPDNITVIIPEQINGKPVYLN